ncbi:UDP-N-acetylglucosamine 1-carboxyvinyltransferase [Thiomicrospira sp. ALE5]|uniref:UDP-N-acetylglucosamine 1-carboxyvinyltransferase n=1 Tax=Thiomicrospira sp. ALE5 TaxID=748650 RepID=UPI0008E072A9|nr:UDP-N-acetylglucosamine 1-carboxyvinyltransferase [Thiomicrospira sp. ALE5]SFR59747.1 UDP-N-acetylglucosamine 1-carboxyvinyltransferase [Thiomicrospira sp. ALE5]
MEKLLIKGGAKLQGEVEISGSKNAALPILMGCILAKTPVTLSNIPHLKDVTTSLQLLATLGGEVLIDERMNITINASQLRDFTAPFSLVKTMRASILVMGPLLARFGEARVALPGGCAIGTRPVDIHIRGFEAMGAKVSIADGFIHAKATRLQGADITMDKVTVTGTENLLMGAVLAKGTTHLRNAACEPEVTDLAIFLTKMGAKITGIGTEHLVIEGVDELNGVDYRVIPDRIEAGTYLAAAAVTGSAVTVTSVEPSHLKSVLVKFTEAGCDVQVEDRKIHLDCRDRQLKSVVIETQPYPGFPTDMQAQFLVMNVLATGPGSIQETIFENRFMHVNELAKMGAHIEVNDNFALTAGSDKLHGSRVMATDLRASACLILAALVAEGETFVEHIYHIDRGYELIEEKFHRLGANIQRLS